MTALDEQYENFTEQLAPIKSWLDKTAVILQESDKLSPEEMISESEISKYKVSKMCSFVSYLLCLFLLSKRLWLLWFLNYEQVKREVIV